MAFNRRTIAAGAFGKVYKEKYGDAWAAIKRVPQHLISKKDLERECRVYNKATHPNIVKLLGDITFEDSKWVLPLEFIFGEDLETTIFKASRSKIQLTPSNKGTIILGMCEGLLHLHLNDIVHQDLKPENIMVEHGTNRAVIIDLGLAKFFRNGLSSAIDMGNEAYSAPEVLRRGSQRDQRSDVWAMGKIIAELCARIRLHTPSVCPAKIKETLRDQPHCHTVCRMVESDPTLRASMAGVINDMRRAGGGGITGGTPPRGHLLVPPPETRNRSLSPIGRTPSPIGRTPSPIGRTPSPRGRAPSPVITLPVNRVPPVSRWERAASPKQENAGLHHRGRAASPKRGNTGLHPQAVPVTHRSPSPRPTDNNKIQALVPAEATGLSQDLMKMMLYKEATKDLPCGLPTTGTVTVRRFEEKDGEVGTWGQTEVVTRGGRIVKYDDIRYNNR